MSVKKITLLQLQQVWTYLKFRFTKIKYSTNTGTVHLFFQKEKQVKMAAWYKSVRWADSTAPAGRPSPSPFSGRWDPVNLSSQEGEILSVSFLSIFILLEVRPCQSPFSGRSGPFWSLSRSLEDGIVSVSILSIFILLTVRSVDLLSLLGDILTIFLFW